MSNNKYHIYKFVNENGSVLYVGKSKNIKSRIQSHIREKDWIQENQNIYIAEACSQTDMDIYELYYINKLSPKYNIANAYNFEFSIELDEINFKHYKTINENDLEYKKVNDSTAQVLRDQNEYKYAFRDTSDGIGHILNKNIYAKIHMGLANLDFIEGYEFQYHDCGHESLKFIFYFDNDKKVYISMKFSYGDLLLLKNSVYNTVIKDALIEIYKNGITKDYVPCQLYTDGRGNGHIKIYNEDNHW